MRKLRDLQSFLMDRELYLLVSNRQLLLTVAAISKFIQLAEQLADSAWTARSEHRGVVVYTASTGAPDWGKEVFRV